MNPWHTWRRFLALALAMMLPLLVAAEQPTCVPIPVEPTCVEIGGQVFPWDSESPDCCDGLRPAGISEIDPMTGACELLDGAMVCLPCGNGVCDAAEDACSCPEDCTEDCVQAGGNVFPWDPSYGVCCPGLQAAGVMDFDETTGTCEPLLGGAVCIACGDGLCGPGEDLCNCPDDCATSCEGLPEDACAARADCEGGYVGDCDCTCPGPVGYEGGGCEGCGADCFGFVACVPAARELQLRYDTDGGFAGVGDRDLTLHNRILTVTSPWGDATACSVELTRGQHERLLAAAGHVDWESLEATYVLPDNPYCCCDQFVHAWSATVTFGDRTVFAETNWCDESRYMSLLPWAFEILLDELSAVADEVEAFCRPLVD